jgi:fibro-slime domain-containing protein
MRNRLLWIPLLVTPGLTLAVFACGGSDGTVLPDPVATVSADAAPTIIPTGFGTVMDASRPDAMLVDPASLCGNSVKNPDTEICDDGNKASGDGCTSGCRVEPGWLCATPGKPCVAIKCGDGVVAGDEDCDDGNAIAGDGCDVGCRVETGYKCAMPGKACEKTTCGDGKKEGTEQCDDGNLDPFDGCNPACEVEPKCAGGSCTSACGDGLKFPSEACDDGNTRNGDGCSSTCQLEPGFKCDNAQGAAPAFKELYIAYRDFLSADGMNGHPDFNNDVNQAFGLATGLVKPSLDADGRPELLSSKGSNTNAGFVIQNATTFSSWYRDTPFSKKVVSKLKLDKQPDGTYRFASDEFFPIDMDPKAWPERQDDGTGRKRNFLFTSELRIPFTYKGGETLNFAGDDDVWVFANGKLVADLGGVKVVQGASVKLDAAKATELGLTVGGMYEFVVFQAERNPTGSNYTLTLTDFDRLKTSCKSVCGDGVKSPDEVCDDGTANNTGAYGKCSPDCSKRGAFCGDGVVQAEAGEQCDSTNDCTADCRFSDTAPK